LLVYITPVDGGHAIDKFSKSRVWDKIPEGHTLVFRDNLISIKHSVAGVEENL